MFIVLFDFEPCFVYAIIYVSICIVMQSCCSKRISWPAPCYYKSKAIAGERELRCHVDRESQLIPQAREQSYRITNDASKYTPSFYLRVQIMYITFDYENPPCICRFRALLNSKHQLQFWSQSERTRCRSHSLHIPKFGAQLISLNFYSDRGI